MKSTWNWRYAVSLTAVLASIALTWSYWTVFEEMAEEWSKNPLYSHGYIVPIFAVALLWLRRGLIPASPLQPSWWALAFLLVAGVMRLGAAYYYYSWPDRGSLLFMIFAMALALGGWAAVRWTWPSILFLVFMIPFPGFIETGLMLPLQRVATLCSTNVLQTLGFFAHADGNIIVLSEAQMNIVEACSGLAMLSTFTALTVGACLFLQRPAWQKVLIILSSIPIALVCNIARISTTGIFHEMGYHEFAEAFHDYAGWLMMPMGLLMLLGELKLLDIVFVIETRKATPAPPSEIAPSQAVQQLGRAKPELPVGS